MADSESKLEKLEAMAAEPSSEKRRALLNEITDMFLGNPTSYSDLESRFFGDIIGEIAFTLEAQIRAALAERLSDEASAPAELIRKLANDEILVARPVIENSPILNENDLVALARQQGQDHLMAITRRRDITEVLSSVLVERGGDPVVEGLLDNQTAAISDGSMTEIIGRAQSSDRLTLSLLRRTDLPKEMTMSIISTISADIRRKIVQQSSEADRSRLETLLEEITGEQNVEIARQQPRISGPESIIKDLVDRGTLTPKTLAEFAGDEKLPEFICGLAELANLDMEAAQKVTMDRSGEGLALISRSCAFSKQTFAAIIHAIGPSLSMTAQDIEQQVQAYDRISVANAQRIFRFWRVRTPFDADATAA